MKQGLNDKRLVDICGIQYGCPFDASLFSTSPSEGMPLIRIRDVKGGQTETYYSGEYSPEFIIRKGDYLIGMDGEFNVAPWQSEDALLNQRVCKIYTKSQDVVIRYVYRFLQKELKKIEDETPFVTVKHLSAKRLNQVYLPVPPIAEQEKIVAELDCLSGIIEKKKQQLKELDNLAQSIFYEMFGDPVENDKGWNVQGFSTACDVITDFVAAGSFADIKKNVQYKESQDYAQLVRTTDLKNKFMKSGFVYISESAFNYLWRVNLNQECIILPNVGVNCGEVYYVNPSMLPYSNNVLGPNAILVRSKKENHRYLSALFTTSYFQCQLKGIVNAVGQPKFNKTELKKLEVILPPLPLQQDFASKIESIEKQKELLAQSIKETETLFNSRMDYYFN